LASIIRNIKQIDRDGNGYVTSTELDDILKLTFPEELTMKRLKPMFKEFASIQNRILIDYKKFRDKLLQLIAKYKEAEDIKKLREEQAQHVANKKQKVMDKLSKLKDSRNQVQRNQSLRKSIDSA
jgi:predicted ribosome quality control (RQC) complex YloA/Tae2 family protein